MPASPSRNNHPVTAVPAGGASAEPTPANNVGGGAGWGDKAFPKGGTDGGSGYEGSGHEGSGHVAATNPRSQMGSFLGLQDQKTRAENKFMQRADLAAADAKPTNEQGEPTCASEDHSFMGHKAGGSATLPGWGTVKNLLGGSGGSSS